MAASTVRRGRGRRAMSEINVTPFVDVMLVLLIISMVAAPMLESGINLELPEAVTGEAIDDARTVVSLDREGKIRVNNKPVFPDLLENQMRQIATSRPSETVFLRADKLLPYGEVLIVMDMIRSAGVTRVSLVTVPLEIMPAEAE